MQEHFAPLSFSYADTPSAPPRPLSLRVLNHSHSYSGAPHNPLPHSFHGWVLCPAQVFNINVLYLGKASWSWNSSLTPSNQRGFPAPPPWVPRCPVGAVSHPALPPWVYFVLWSLGGEAVVGKSPAMQISCVCAVPAEAKLGIHSDNKIGFSWQDFLPVKF